MPLTPNLPLKLYEKLRDDAMTELLTLFSNLDAGIRTELRELRQEVRQDSRPS